MSVLDLEGIIGGGMRMCLLTDHLGMRERQLSLWPEVTDKANGLQQELPEWPAN